MKSPGPDQGSTFFFTLKKAEKQAKDEVMTEEQLEEIKKKSEKMNEYSEFNNPMVDEIPF